jgi:predicted PurR-regulated permease PerM
MNASVPSPAADGTGGRELAVFISIRTILLVGVAVALAWALASVGHVLLLIFVSIFSVAVLSPVVDLMERKLPWNRAVSSTVLVLGIVLITAVALLILLQPIVDAVRNFTTACRG